MDIKIWVVNSNTVTPAFWESITYKIIILIGVKKRIIIHFSLIPRNYIKILDMIPVLNPI